MRSFILGFILMLLIGCQFKERYSEPKLLSKRIVYLSGQDSAHILYGDYKKIYYTYNYEYTDSMMICHTLDKYHQYDVYINEWCDTVYQIYVDVTNYPRREE